MERERRQMPRLIHRLRVLGMGLGGIAIAAVLLEHRAPWTLWAWLAFTSLLWPQLAYLWATRSDDPYRAELRNLLVDSAMAGAWVPLLHFDLLPSVLLVTLTTVDKISSGVPGLWLRSLPGMAAGVLAGGLLTGFAFDPHTSMPVLLACLPIIVIHTIAVSLASYRLIRQVARQNHLLDQLRRTDALTGLSGRGYWLEQAHAALAHGREGGPASGLLLIDLDDFKLVNDGRGHGAGDDVLRAFADTLQALMRPEDLAGRLGGDEFAVLMRGATEAATARMAARIRQAVADMALPSLPGLRATASIGVATSEGHAELRTWMEAADAALYRAKRDGRNQVALAPAVA